MQRNTVALYPSPGRGHLASMIELGKLITKHDPCISVTVIIIALPHEAHSIESYTSKVSLANPSITFVHLLPPSNLPSVPPTSPQDIIASFFEVPKLFNKSLHAALSVLSKSTNLKALVIDFLCNAAVEVSSSLHIPTYYFCTHGACGISVFLSFPSVVHMNTPKSLKDLGNVLLEFPGTPPIPSKDLPLILLDRSHRIYNYFIDTSTKMAKSSGLILNTFESLEQRAIEAILEGKCKPGLPRVPSLYCVGPVVTSTNEEDKVKEEEQECSTWLASQPSQSVLFLCFGSMGVFSTRQLKEMAIGLEKSGVRFLWVVRNPPEDGQEISQIQTLTPTEPKFELESLFPQGFLERTRDRGLVVKLWAPQVAVLNHPSVGGFVTHSGWNSVLEAVCAGVPMLSWPLYAEQKMNRVFLVEEMKVALAVKQSEDGLVTAAELEERVTELMNSEKGKAVREKVMAMKDGAITATREGGSSYAAMAKLGDSFRQG